MVPAPLARALLAGALLLLLGLPGSRQGDRERCGGACVRAAQCPGAEGPPGAACPPPLVCCEDKDRLSRRSIAPAQRAKVRDTALADAVRATSEAPAPAALPLTLRPGTAPALASTSASSSLRWAPEDDTPALPIPLLPPSAPRGGASPAASSATSETVAPRSWSSPPLSLQDTGADGDVWFPETPTASHHSPTAHRPPASYRWPSEGGTKRAPPRPAPHAARRPHQDHGDSNAPGAYGTYRPHNDLATNSRRQHFQQAGAGAATADAGGTTRFRPTPTWGPPATSPKRASARAPSVSDRKCAEYARLQTERVVALPLLPEPRPSVQHVQKCDTNSVPLVVGGQDARLNEFPHMAAIGYRGAASGSRIDWNCGGSLISELFVLTAAHCTATAQGPPIRVRLGEHNLESADDGARPVDVAVSSMVRHPAYRPPARYHDVGLLRLARRVALSAAVRPACLHTATDDAADDALVGEPLIATGWGHTEQLGERSQVLQKAVLKVVDHRTCSSLYAADAATSSLARGIAADSQLCAGVLEGGTDTCQGDSGGPLQVSSHNNQCVFHIVGITSFGKVCAARNSPGVYTRVARYVPWIERHVWPEEGRRR